MDWKIEFQTDAEQDLSLIFDHLFETYQELGDDPRLAFDRASNRVLDIRDSALKLKDGPHRGTKRESFGKGIRNLTIKQAVIWFSVDDDARLIRILAFFFGGQDHHRHMLTRLLNRA